jgi:hypothetical protein
VKSWPWSNVWNGRLNSALWCYGARPGGWGRRQKGDARGGNHCGLAGLQPASAIATHGLNGDCQCDNKVDRPGGNACAASALTSARQRLCAEAWRGRLSSLRREISALPP